MASRLNRELWVYGFATLSWRPSRYFLSGGYSGCTFCEPTSGIIMALPINPDELFCADCLGCWVEIVGDDGTLYPVLSV